MPVRKVVRRSGKNFRGYFPSRRLGRLVGWESLHERDAIRLVEYDPTVASYEEQPSEEIYYEVSGKARRYYPDLRVHYRNGRVVDIEVKPRQKLEDPRIEAKFKRIQKRYKELGRRFEIWTEREIRAEPRFSEVARIHRARPRLRKAA